MIQTESTTDSSAATVHELLVDVDAWSLWSPHVASVSAVSRRVEPGWVGETRAFFAPAATTMRVDEVRPDGGYRWSTTVGPWHLDYDNAVEATADGATIRFTAELSGPGAAVLERIVAPVSALGQRRRIARLAALAELVDRTG
ncbi:MAG: SRPBCC family protein [Actinomycetota bacterium]